MFYCAFNLFTPLNFHENKQPVNVFWQGDLFNFPKARILRLFALFFFLLSGQCRLCLAQQLSSENLLETLNLPSNKLPSYLLKNKFVFQEKYYLGDTVLNRFNGKRSFLKDTATTTFRCFFQRQIGHNYAYVYQTSSLAEFDQLINNFKASGFSNYASVNTLQFEPSILQYQNTRITTSLLESDTIKRYCLQLEKDELPLAKNLNYADDLFAFSSEECLKFYFGKNSVVTDEYYFFNNEVVPCSVLFINTDHQVVFIWQDQKNRSIIRQLLFGGEQRLESAKHNNNFIAENKWKCKSGLQPGMPLMQLRKLNGEDFKFQSGYTPYFGTVLPDTTGKINFKKEQVILGCVNCKDPKFLSTSIVSADDAVADQKILFVLSVVLIP